MKLRSQGGEWDEAMLPFRLQKNAQMPQENQQENSRGVRERTTNGCSQVQRTPPPSSPTSLPAGRACRRRRKQGNRGRVPGWKIRPPPSPLRALEPQEGPQQRKGVIRRTGPCVALVRLNETVRAWGGHGAEICPRSDRRRERAWGIVSGKTSPAAVPEGWVAPFLISLVFVYIWQLLWWWKKSGVYW